MLFGMSTASSDSGMSRNQGWRAYSRRWRAAMSRRPCRQSSVDTSTSPMTSAAASCISMTSSSLLETYRYSDMVVNPSDSATRAMVTAPSPPSSAMATAARAMASCVISRRGPRLGASSMPQAMTRARGIGVGAAVTGHSVARTVYITDCVRHTQRMTYTVISVDALVARYGDLVVLDHLTLDVGPGVLALLGPNGAGKTTLVDTVTTLRRPDAGRVRVLGHDVVEDTRSVRGLLGVTGQQASVDFVLTGRENLVLTGRLLGLGRA